MAAIFVISIYNYLQMIMRPLIRVKYQTRSINFRQISNNLCIVGTIFDYFRSKFIEMNS